MADIKNYDTYNSNMAKSMLDKVFFMDKIECNYMVDYGCADGALIEFLTKLFPDFIYVGYDIDPHMIELAKAKKIPRALFFSDFEEVISNVDVSDAVIVLSSIIHEAYAYGTRADVATMWENALGRHFKNVVIRDMIPSMGMEKPSDINDYHKVLTSGNAGQIRDFEKIWGSLENNKNLIHFLLKYQYIDNWEREVQENYLPMTREHLLFTIGKAYRIEFHEHFVLPFLRRSVKRDFDIDIKDNTHLKLILERRS